MRAPNPNKTCGVDFCDRGSYGNNFACEMHYKRWRKRGSYELPVYKPQPCSVSGCDREERGRTGVCGKHRQLWQRKGTYEAEARHVIRSLTDIQTHSAITDEGCWVLPHKPTLDGYVRIRFNSVSWLAHRLSYSLHTGKEVVGRFIHHKCANRLCVNPDHLQDVTHRDNVAEMLARKTYENQIAQLEQRVTLLQNVVDRLLPEHPLSCSA